MVYAGTQRGGGALANHPMGPEVLNKPLTGLIPSTPQTPNVIIVFFGTGTTVWGGGRLG